MDSFRVLGKSEQVIKIHTTFTSDNPLSRSSTVDYLADPMCNCRYEMLCRRRGIKTPRGIDLQYIQILHTGTLRRLTLLYIVCSA